jgi:creatinase
MIDRPQTLPMRNGEPVPGTFPAEEMERRQAALRAHMATAGIDAVLFTSYHNINYYADFLPCRFGRHYGLVVTPERATTISAGIDGGQPRRRTFGDNLVYTDWHRGNFLVAVQKLIRDGMCVGIEYDDVSIELRKKLEGALPAARFLDIGQAAMRMRMIKSDAEIAHIRESARIANVGGHACLEVVDVGVPEHEVALHATQAMVREIARTFPHAELMDTWTWFQSGINTDGAHNPLTSRRVRDGDILSINCFPMPAGYYTALERTAFAGGCSAEHERLWRINTEVFEQGRSLIRPGVRCSEIAHELNAIYDRHGLLPFRSFGYGHSFGVLSHYYGREAGLEIREDVETVLEPGMVISMEPMIMMPEGMPGAGGYREHDILVVTTDGADNITGFPYGPDSELARLGSPTAAPTPSRRPQSSAGPRVFES